MQILLIYIFFFIIQKIWFKRMGTIGSNPANQSSPHAATLPNYRHDTVCYINSVCMTLASFAHSVPPTILFVVCDRLFCISLTVAYGSNSFRRLRCDWANYSPTWAVSNYSLQISHKRAISTAAIQDPDWLYAADVPFADRIRYCQQCGLF